MTVKIRMPLYMDIYRLFVSVMGTIPDTVIGEKPISKLYACTRKARRYICFLSFSAWEFIVSTSEVIF